MKTKVDEGLKNMVARDYIVGDKQVDIARSYGISRRTVGRILEERGFLTPAKQVKRQLQPYIEVIKKHNLSPKALDSLLTSPATLTLESVQAFLNNCTSAQLARLFYNSGIVKVAEIFAKEQEAKKQKDKETVDA